MELFDVIDSKGNPAGQIVSREKAHVDYSEKGRQSADSFTETLTKQGFFSGKI